VLPALSVLLMECAVVRVLLMRGVYREQLRGVRPRALHLGQQANEGVPPPPHHPPHHLLLALALAERAVHLHRVLHHV
jgi:hypothetical protein